MVDVGLHRGAEGSCPSGGCGQVVGLEPHRDPVSQRMRGITERPVVMPDVQFVQLQHEYAAVLEPLVLRPAVRTLRAENRAVPGAALLHVADRDQRLWPHDADATAGGATRS